MSMTSGSAAAIPEHEKPPSHEVAPPYVSSKPVVALNIVHWSIWGVLARRGLTALTTYSGAYVGGVVWANFAACLVMGVMVYSSRVWSRVSKKSELYIGISTGFCGTCSSFSSLILDAFFRSTDTVEHENYHYPNGAYGIMGFFSVILTQTALSALAMIMGSHLALRFDSDIPPLTHTANRRTAVASSGVGIVLVVIIVVLIATQNYGTWRSWMFSCLFAPLGALTRYYLAPLNARSERFPVGTFLANIVGTVLIAVFTLIVRGKAPTKSTVFVLHRTGCQVIQGLIDGYCGGLTTVSTFVAEIFALQTSAKYSYSISTIVSGFVPVLLILGTYNWTHGLGSAVCS